MDEKPTEQPLFDFLEQVENLLHDSSVKEERVRKIIELQTKDWGKMKQLEILADLIKRTPIHGNNARAIVVQEADNIILELLKEAEELPKKEAENLLKKYVRCLRVIKAKI